MTDRIKKLRDEARALLDKAASILSRAKVSDAQASIAVSYQKEAKEKIDLSAKLIAVLDAGKDLDAGNGEVKKKMETKDKGGFEDIQSFLGAVYNASKGYRDERLVLATKDMAEGAGVTGGYLVPAGHAQEIYALGAEQSIVETRAHVFDIPGRDISLPALDQTGSVAGKPNFWGMVEMEWIEEGGTKPLTEPVFKEIELVVHGLKGFAIVSDELVTDSNPSVSAFLMNQLAGATSWWKDRAYLQGDGVGKPLGVIGAAGTFTQVRVAANAFGYVDAVNMMLHFRKVKGGVWVLHQSVMADLYTMQDPGNNYVFVQGASGAPATSLLGYPVLWTENTQTLGTTGDVILADFSQYYIARNKGITVEVSREHLFRNDQTCFRVVARVDGQPAVQQPIYLADGATQVSPFVELDASTA